MPNIRCHHCKSNHVEVISSSNGIYKCKSCRSVISESSEEVKIQFEIALNLRENYEFDKARDTYLKILNSTDNDRVKADAYYGLILANFGIIEIIGFSSKIATPTFCKYDNFKSSIKDSEYYQKLIELKIDDSVRNFYIEKIDKLEENYQELKKDMVSIPIYDAFICVKVSNATEEHPEYPGYTKDSKRGAEIYESLSKLKIDNKPLKIFYSEITLKGIENDSKIYSALTKSKCFILISSSIEYINSTWVKSEWKRWYNLINCTKIGYNKKDDNSIFALLLEGINKTDLPTEIAHTQTYVSDLKLVEDVKCYLLEKSQKFNDSDEDNPTKVIIDKYNIDPLLRKMFSYLKNGDWNAASQSIKKVLDTDPECSMGYLGKLMYELKLTDVEMLCEARIPQLTTRESFNLACKYASIDELKKLKEYEYNNAYSHGLYLMKNAKNEKDLEAASAWFELYPSFKDCKKKRKACLRKAKRIIKEKRKLERETEKKRKACLRQPKHIIKARKKLESKLDKIRKGISENVAFLFISILIVIIVAVDCYACHVLIKYCSATWGKWLLWPVLISLVPSVLTSYLVSRFNFKEWQFTTIKWIKIIGGCMRGSIIATSFTYWWGNVQSAIVRLLLMLIICLINCICYIISAGVDEIIYENHYS